MGDESLTEDAWYLVVCFFPFDKACKRVGKV